MSNDADARNTPNTFQICSRTPDIFISFCWEPSTPLHRLGSGNAAKTSRLQQMFARKNGTDISGNDSILRVAL